MMPDLVLVFALASVLLFMHTVYSVLSSSLGVTGIKITTVSIAVISVMCAVLSFILIPMLQIRGAAISLAASYAVGLVFIYAVLRRHLSANAAKGPSGTSRERAKNR